MAKPIKPEHVKYLADLLISTLGDVKPGEADAIVERVALIMYNDLLGIEGRIKESSFRLCDAYGMTYSSDREFVPVAKSDQEPTKQETPQ